LSEALAAVHAAGIAHRDVKAENVMIEPSGRVVLMDFSIGVATGVRSPAVAGTPLYAAPELFLQRGRQDGTALDIYSAGVLLFHLASAAYPVAARSLTDLRAAHREHRYLTVSDIRPQFPRPLATVIERAIHPEAQRRFKSAVELSEALRACDESFTTQPVASRWRRLPLQAVASAAVCLFAGSGDASVRQLADPPAVVHVEVSGATVRSLGSYFAPAFASQIEATLRLGSPPDDRAGVATLNLSFEEINQSLSITADLRRQGSPVWKRQFVRPLTNARHLQADIAGVLGRLLGHQPRTRDVLPGSQVAYEAFLRGTVASERRTPEALLAARDAFEEAVQADPEYAVAYAALANSYSLLAAFGVVPHQDALLRARVAADRAVANNPGSAEAQTAMAYVLWQSSEFAAAKGAFERAIALDAKYALAHHWYGLVLLDTDPVPGLEHLEKAFELAPHSPTISTDLGVGYVRSGQIDRAVAHLTRTVATFPNHDEALTQLAVAHYRGREYTEAEVVLERLLQRKPDHLAALALLGRIKALLQNTGAARAILAQLNARRRESFVDPRLLLGLHAALGEQEQALSLIERHADAHWLEYLSTEPDLAPLRDEPRFRAVYDRLTN
jgi:Tfp pilus assembly protein PilF